MAQYYIYRISQVPGSMVKNLQKQESHPTYREAKQRVSALREENEGSPDLFKIIFAENELEAEEKLGENREAQILQEWEK